MNLILFKNKIPKEFLKIQEVLNQVGFIPTVIGGVVRDFILNETISTDWDVELTHPSLSFSKDLWKDLGRRLAVLGKVSYFPYEIIKLEMGEFSFEFSPPRVESFTGDVHHKNFHATFDLRLPFTEAIKRRDFTINAMGICFEKNGLVFLDPLEGARHLSEKTLHPVGVDFHQDPVRYLRAMRFKVKFKFDFSDSLAKEIKKMNLGFWSSSYFWKEATKSLDPLKFMIELQLSFGPSQDVKLPFDAKIIQYESELRALVKIPNNLENWLLAFSWLDLPTENWIKYFSISDKVAKSIDRWCTESKFLKTITPERFQGEFEAVIKIQEFERFFDWFHTTKNLLLKLPELPLLSLIETHLDDWIYLYKFEPLKDVKHIDPPLRSKYQLWQLCQRV